MTKENKTKLQYLRDRLLLLKNEIGNMEGQKDELMLAILLEEFKLISKE